MARYTGPKNRISRRLGADVFDTRRSGLEKRPYPPGQHGRGRIRETEYLLQLREKQKARAIYGLLEKQFRNLYEEANRRPGITGENLLRMLEQRLDNVVFRAQFGSTRPQARQLVNHGHVNVNGKRVDIPSYRVKVGDVVEVKEKSRNMALVLEAMQSSERDIPDYLEVGDRGFSVRWVRVPELADVPFPVKMEPNLVVEYYSS